MDPASPMTGFEREIRSYRFGEHQFRVEAKAGLTLSVFGRGKDGDIVDDEVGAKAIDAAARSVAGVERSWSNTWTISGDAALAALIAALPGEVRLVEQVFDVSADSATALWELFLEVLSQDSAFTAARSYWTWRESPQGPLQVAMEMELTPDGSRFHAKGYDFMARYDDYADHSVFEELLARVAGGAPRTAEFQPRLRRADLTVEQHEALAHGLVEIPGLHDVTLRVSYA